MKFKTLFVYAYECLYISNIDLILLFSNFELNVRIFPYGF